MAFTASSIQVLTKHAVDENALIEWGVSDEDITVREKIIICDEADEAATRAQIEQMYNKYRQVSKVCLL